ARDARARRDLVADRPHSDERHGVLGPDHAFDRARRTASPPPAGGAPASGRGVARQGEPGAVPVKPLVVV
ncbi:hypothetical protein ACNQUF_12500, partial [Corynebacterium diphtheriae]